LLRTGPGLADSGTTLWHMIPLDVPAGSGSADGHPSSCDAANTGK
jgi:hypothetical protein